MYSDVAHREVQWQLLLNTAMNLRIPYKKRNFLAISAPTHSVRMIRQNLCEMLQMLHACIYSILSNYQLSLFPLYNMKSQDDASKKLNKLVHAVTRLTYILEGSFRIVASTQYILIFL
jgi:hypothetical protein